MRFDRPVFMGDGKQPRGDDLVLSLKGETDLELLYGCIEPSIGSNEFFLRKAIGWALRQYAWTDPAEVWRYVRVRGEELSALTKREALKNL